MKHIIFNMNANTPWRRLLAIPIVVALFVLAGWAGPAFAQFFQGFEQNTSNWFETPTTIPYVNRVSSPDQSTSYNPPGTTSVYGVSPIPAASGSWLGRVKSAISNGTCTIDTTGAIGPSLLCSGPYTDFGLTPAFHVAGEFPTAGYTIQLDIYLDVNYAAQHPDCTTAPCVPNTPGTVNTACVPGPDTTLACEGSRFDWTVGLNNAGATTEMAPEFVFSVGTAPAPPQWGLTGCDTGWIITAGYNSFRSGGDTYNPGFEPRCLSTSGWYTFKQVYKDDGSGNLEVDFSILDSSGIVVACKDLNTGDPSTCSWVRHPVDPDNTLPPNTPLAISKVGCPRFGWLANEEINDLPLDNTRLSIVGCGSGTGFKGGQIAPTGTTCQQYLDGSAATLNDLLYTTKGNNMNAVSPGVFFYYTTVTGNAGDTVTINEKNDGTPAEPPIGIQKSQVVLYSKDCSKLQWTSLDVNPDGSATGVLPSSGDFIIGVKYESSSLKGDPIPVPPSITYTFGVNGFLNPASIDLSKK